MRLGTLSLHIPKLRQGRYFLPFLEPRKTRKETLLTTVIAVAAPVGFRGNNRG